ncbi:hypothetical protein [Arthrobacter sp. JSM 101049]|uniref:hypothetical protein n=1 Tax=Arthrobacter sp. JSM 101049 TaxID=929097 RepID=UPI003569FD21
MTTFAINSSQDQTGGYQRVVEAARYKQEGDYFVFYADASFTKKVLTVKAALVSTIDTEHDNKK